jgi:UDP-glucose 4-epimerase
MKILLFGYGFLGRHVVRKLVDCGHEVTVVDRETPNAVTDGCHHLVGDVRDAKLVTELVENHDGVINLAGLLGTSELMLLAKEAVNTNITGALNVFEACRRRALEPGKSPRAVQISVGNYFMLNAYAITKHATERFALMYNAEHGTQVAVVRAMNAYGEGQKDSPIRKLVPNLIASAIRGQPMTIYGSGDQIMDMIYADDVAEVLVRSVIRDHGVFDRVLEAGTGRRTSVNYIAYLVRRLCESDVPIQHLDMRPGEPLNAVVVGDPATLAPLGLTAHDFTQLEQGLERTIRWYRDTRFFE